VEELRVSELVPIGSASKSEASLDAASASHDDDKLRLASDPSRIARRTRLDFVDLPSGSLVGEYEIERKIGEGGMGAVYAAVHPVLGKRAAIKVMSTEISKDENAIARFRREARAVAQLASPHIVDVFGFGELADGRAYFVMEYLVGESLRERLSRGRVPLDEALELLDQMAGALEVAHEAGIVHRDLKPENVFIERGRGATPVVKLLDFGIVKLAKHDEDVAKTQAGVLIGTPVYVAPEQIRAASDVDHRADIYALGGVAFEMVLGRVPFVRSTVVELIAAHLECAPPQPRSLWPEIPPALDALLSAMLAKDPAKRPTLGYMQEAIEKLRRGAFARTIPTVGVFEPSVSTMAPIDESPVAKQAPLVAPVESSTPPQITFGIALGTRTISVPPIGAPTAVPSRWWSRRTAIIGGALGALIFVIAIASTRDVTPAPMTSRSVTTAADGSAPPMGEIEQAAQRADAAVTSHVIATPITSQALPQSSAETKPPESPITNRPTAALPAAPAQRAHSTADVPPPEPIVAGELSISSKPPCEVAIDGKSLGRRTPISSLSLEGGIHRVTLENAQFGISESVYVQILPGKAARIVKDYSAKLRVDPNGTIDPFAKGSGQ
jgi:serine/threonine-protein kinase